MYFVCIHYYECVFAIQLYYAIDYILFFIVGKQLARLVCGTVSPHSQV
jgi:hypothetical protein